MININKAESKLLLKIFKDFSRDYNANSISKEIGITPRGALKILKKLKAQNLLKDKQLGRAVFYKINFDDKYAIKIIETLLIAEARERAERWVKEFNDIFKSTDIVILFGSIIRNEKKAGDIDVLLVFKRREYDKISDFINKKNKILFKKIHEIPQTMQDLKENLREKNKAMIEAVREGYILHGQDKLIDVIKDVTSF